MPWERDLTWDDEQLQKKTPQLGKFPPLSQLGIQSQTQLLRGMNLWANGGARYKKKEIIKDKVEKLTVPIEYSTHTHTHTNGPLWVI